MVPPKIMAPPKIPKTRTNHGNDSTNGKAVAWIFVFLLYGLLFTYLYQYRLDITKAVPNEASIEIVLEKEIQQQKIPQGVPHRNPEQKPVPKPPVLNVPGATAPPTATVAAVNQSTLPQPRPETKPAEVAEQGDVEKPAPKPTINERSLFSSTTKGEEEDHTSNNINQHSLYNGVGRDIKETRTEDTPMGPDHRMPVTANLEGRTVIGSLPQPTGNQNEGTVVVEITVDQNGTVIKAAKRLKGTTVQDGTLWKAAETAALKARFNVKKDAPVYQIGTITYVFKLS